MTICRSTNRLIVNYVNRCFLTNANCNLSAARSPNFFAAQVFRNVVCWKCGAERTNVAQLFCEKCNVIQSPQEKENYFKVFEINEQFNIDHELVKSKFRKLQSVLHPDKFGNRTDEERSISEEYSSLLNKAYSSLQTPLKRAEHLLHLRGETIEEGQTVSDSDFLVKVMTLNEEVEDAKQDVKLLKELNEKNKMELEKLSVEINNAFIGDDLQKAKEYIIKLKYFTSISNRVNAILRELGETD